jgi:indole-3-glycerol phosphate synthase
LTETQGFRVAASGGHILDRIVATKSEEAAALRGRGASLRRVAADAPPALAFGARLRSDDTVALIAEVKRGSPGAGAIRPDLDPAAVARAYERAGAAAVSVLTDGPWFRGSLDDLRAVRVSVGIPVLRKDFTLVPEQVLEARGAGADAVLLIVRILEDAPLRELRELAESLGMTALVEVHDAAELERALASGARVVGVNNRDLTTFRTALAHTFDLLPRVPAGVIVVSESGIRTAADVDGLGGRGVDAVLVGEALLREPDPGVAAAALVGRPRRERVRA